MYRQNNIALQLNTLTLPIIN